MVSGYVVDVRTLFAGLIVRGSLPTVYQAAWRRSVASPGFQAVVSVGICVETPSELEGFEVWQPELCLIGSKRIRPEPGAWDFGMVGGGVPGWVSGEGW